MELSNTTSGECDNRADASNIVEGAETLTGTKPDEGKYQFMKYLPKVNLSHATQLLSLNSSQFLPPPNWTKSDARIEGAAKLIGLSNEKIHEVQVTNSSYSIASHHNVNYLAITFRCIKFFVVMTHQTLATSATMVS